MKIKHNKKRNTAFVFEALVKEMTNSIVKKQSEKTKKIVNIIKKHFNKKTLLYKDLQCYRSLYEEKYKKQNTALRILNEVKSQKRLIDPQGLFAQQTDLIHDINKEIGPSVFNNFVPNYRHLATIQQILSPKTSPKNKIMLENNIIESIIKNNKEDNRLVSIDNLTYKSAVSIFNKKYDKNLTENQKKLLSYYVVSFSDNSLQMKMFLNEEISRLKKALSDSKDIDYFKNDPEMTTKADAILEKLEGFSQSFAGPEDLGFILKTQSLVEEICNGDND